MRVRLRDDPRPSGCCGTTVALSDDLSARAGLDDDGCTPGPGTSVVLPRIWVADRVAAGESEDGNPRWAWVDLVENQLAQQYEQREKREDRAGVTLVRAYVVFARPSSATLIRETARVRTDDGRRWYVTAVTQGPTTCRLDMERVDDGP